jgi:hypothetical protein
MTQLAKAIGNLVALPAMHSFGLAFQLDLVTFSAVFV